jgi:hypothetical protein
VAVDRRRRRWRVYRRRAGGRRSHRRRGGRWRRRSSWRRAPRRCGHHRRQRCPPNRAKDAVIEVDPDIGRHTLRQEAGIYRVRAQHVLSLRKRLIGFVPVTDLDSPLQRPNTSTSTTSNAATATSVTSARQSSKCSSRPPNQSLSLHDDGSKQLAQKVTCSASRCSPLATSARQL